MISSFKAKSLRRLLLLLISFAMLSFLAACGGTIDSTTTEAGAGSISLQASVETLAAGKSSILTATVTDGEGKLVNGKAVSFSFVNNRSGASISTLNGGVTDSSGRATAVYTAGTNNTNNEVQDNLQASISGSSTAITITRQSTSTASTALHVDGQLPTTSAAAGESIMITAEVTDGSANPVSGQAVSFTFVTNNSGATLTIVGTGVSDNDGHAIVIYKAGANTPESSVQDTVLISIPGSSKMAIITRTSASATATGTKLALSADNSSLTAGNSTLVRAKLTSGSTGSAIVGTAVAFSFATNNSGGTLTPLNGGLTDSSGEALATYTAGANSPAATVQDILQASVTGATGAVIISRTAGGGTSTGLTLTLTSAFTSLAAGESSILTATVTGGSGAVAGQTVTFSFIDNLSGAHLSSYSVTTDASGVATTVYTAGAATGTTVQDIIQASVTGSTKVVIITRTGSAASVTPAFLDITASTTELDTKSASASIITVKALNANYAEIADVVVTMSAQTTAGSGAPGVLSAPTVTTPGTLNFACGSNKWNRTATITATAGSVSAQIPITLSGTTITVTPTSTAISNDGTEYTLTITVKDAGSNAISGAAIALAQAPADAGTGSVTFGATSGTTTASGIFTTTLKGVTNGKVTITATANGSSGTATVTVADSSETFHITSPTNPAAMKIGESRTVDVSAPSCTQVQFLTSIGKFDGTGNTVTKTVSGGTASAVLTTDVIGLANVEVYCVAGSAASDSLLVAMTSGNPPAKIVLQAASTVISVSSGTTKYFTSLIATVYDASNNPLAGIPIAFSIVDGTGTSGGETLSPVKATTLTNPDYINGLSMGQTQTYFYSGTMSSSGTGVKIRATVIGSLPSVETGTSPSGNDVAIVIGGTAGSIAFGWDSKAAEDATGGNYEYKMSVLVADANGNPVQGTEVSLGVWPIAWAPGLVCDPDPSGLTDVFYANEDLNENLILDGTDLGAQEGEDGTRYIWDTTTHTKTYVGAGTVDYLLTPTNSVGGTVPSTVITGINGVAGFTLTYPKSSGIWIWDRIRATTIVQGTETRAETYLHLNIVVGDESICNESPFKY